MWPGMSWSVCDHQTSPDQSSHLRDRELNSAGASEDIPPPPPGDAALIIIISHPVSSQWKYSCNKVLVVLVVVVHQTDKQTNTWEIWVNMVLMCNAANPQKLVGLGKYFIYSQVTTRLIGRGLAALQVFFSRTLSDLSSPSPLLSILTKAKKIQDPKTLRISTFLKHFHWSLGGGRMYYYFKLNYQETSWVFSSCE